ncbi:YbiU family protein [Shigella flexneri]
MAYVLLRPLLDDVPEDELCGVAPEEYCRYQSNGIDLLIQALTSIPKVLSRRPRLVALRRHPFRCPRLNQQGWATRCTLPAAPMCEKNLAYAHKVKAALEKSASPGDFPRRTMKQTGKGRFTLADLNIDGKECCGMDV